MSKIIGIFAAISVAMCLPAPLIFLLYNFIASFCFYLYKKINYSEQVHTNPRKFWHRPVSVLSKFWNIVGYIWHGT